VAIDLDFSYELDGFEFGRGTNYQIAEVAFNEAELSTHDAQLAAQDGISFGRDFRGGQIISFSGNVLTNRSNPGDPVAAPNAQNVLATAWDRKDIRMSPGTVIPLRMHRNGRQRKVFGRPRRFVALAGMTTRGLIPFSCDFQCADQYFYSDVENQESITMIPAEAGGISGDLIGDIIASSIGFGTNQIVVSGTEWSWLKFKIYGPSLTGVFSNPDIEVVGHWRIEMNTTIAYDDSVTIDPKPWTRSVRRTLNNANLSGSFTADSPVLSSLRVPPGTHQIILRGIDVSGTARVEVSWHDTYGSF
jgi:hypothetical protein